MTPNLPPFYDHQKTLMRHRIRIRDYMKVSPWQSKGKNSPQRFAVQVAIQASQTMNNPADIINVVIERLVDKRIELPAFDTLDRIVRHARAKVNQEIFQKIFKHLKENNQIDVLDKLIVVEKDEDHSSYQKLKQIPKAPTTTHFKQFAAHHNWLISLGTFEHYLKDIPKIKIKQFAEEAKTLDVNNLKDVSEPKKYTLIVCLLYRAQQIAKDALGTFNCKIISGIHKSAKKELDALQKKIQNETKNIAQLMFDVATDYKKNSRRAKIFTANVKEKMDNQGGVDHVIQTCQTIINYNSKNHFPFLWKYFKGKRSALFDFINAIQICSSTHDQRITGVLTLLKDQRFSQADSLTLNTDIDLSFITDKWNDFVFVNEKERLVDRRHLELCLFSTLASELRSGDAYIAGADAFSDYRDHLLTLEECSLLIEDYLTPLKLPTTADTFVDFLRKELSQKITYVDERYPDLSDFNIDKDGVPMLKKVVTEKPSKHTIKMVKKIHNKMPERSLLDILCLTHHLTGWAHEFAPISGSDTKIENPIERYILNVFCQGTAMGSAQGAKHIKNTVISSHILSWIHRRHVTPKDLDKAKNKIINIHCSITLQQRGAIIDAVQQMVRYEIFMKIIY